MREYSHGFHSYVYHTTLEQKQSFPGADLVKEISCNDPNWYMRWYLGYQIARLLLPENVIDVVGAQILPAEPEDPELQPYRGIQFPYRRQLLFSRLASVPETHATFSKHMDLVNGRKQATCGCPDCASHKRIHQRFELAERAFTIAGKADQAGIILPGDDPSDYCVTKDEKVVFFEMENLEPETLRTYLNQMPDFPKKDLCQIHLDDHQQLFAQSRAAFKRGLCSLRVTDRPF